MTRLKPYAKAAAAFILPAASTIGTAMLDGNLTGPELIAGLGFGLLTGAGVYWVPNTPAR